VKIGETKDKVERYCGRRYIKGSREYAQINKRSAQERKERGFAVKHPPWWMIPDLSSSHL
jgi:hypothetical protein